MRQPRLSCEIKFTWSLCAFCGRPAVAIIVHRDGPWYQVCSSPNHGIGSTVKKVE